MYERGLVRGVNLGDWLVMEKWMGNSPLAHAAAEDDRAWIDEVPPRVRAEASRAHYASFVTEPDVAQLAHAGANLLRVPVPYHVFGTAHHVACVPYLDKLFDWCEAYDLHVLLDLHTVRLSQNGFDNGGYTALCAWGRDRERMRETLRLLERLAGRYAGRRALWGIEPLNEPVGWLQYVANLPKMRHHPRRILRSRPVPRRRLLAFYQDFYDCVRPVVGPNVALVFHDRFCLRGWERFDPGHADPRVVIDAHQYAGFADGRLQSRDLASYLRLVERMGEQVRGAAAHHPVLVGEWSLANHATDRTGLSRDELRAWYRAFADAQLAAWDAGGVGSCFWSWRVADPRRRDWDFVGCVNRGWLDLRPHA